MKMDQQQLILKLRSKILQIPETSANMDPTADPVWRNIRSILRQHILHDDPENFCNWEMIRYSMFFEPDIVELHFLQTSEDWHQWKTAIRESKAGNPRPYPAYNESSGNLIHHAYHLAQLIKATKCPVRNIPQVIEFGGGYGSMCRLFYQLGFKGRYIIYDLPELSALQEYYLKSIGIPTTIKNEPTNDRDCVVLLSDLYQLLEQIQDYVDNYIFIATWSISETPLDFRNHIFNLVPHATYYLIGYAEQFEGIDNHKFFDNFASSKSDFKWKHTEIEHLKGHRYLIGTNRLS